MRRRNRRKKQKRLIIVSVICLTFIMVSGYAAFSTNLSIGAKGNIVDKNRTIQSWSKTSNEDFHTDFYRENIISATFLNSADVPEGVRDKWDVSVDKKRGVMAYVVESTTETGKYDLFIGAKDGVIANENSSWLFYNFSGLKSIEFGNNFNTSNVLNMSYMFTLCTSLPSIDISSFDTAKLTNMSWMFAMFDGTIYKDSKLTNIIGIEDLNTSNVTNMASVFRYDMHLGESLNLSKWDVSKVTDLSCLFDCMYSIKHLDISTWDTSNVTNMQKTFYGMSALEELNLCSFNTAKVTDMSRMFYGTTNLTKIKVGPNWTTGNANTTNMFEESKISSVTSGEC